MALVELKSNLANFRGTFTTPPLEDTVNAGSQLNIDSPLSKFWTGDPDSATQQRKAPSKYKSEKTIPFTSDRWIGKTPPAANGIDDKRSGATGFIVGASNKNNTAFIGANVAAGTYDYPTSVINITISARPTTDHDGDPLDQLVSLIFCIWFILYSTLNFFFNVFKAEVVILILRL